MEMLSKKKSLLIVFLTIFSCFIVMPKVNAFSYDMYKAKYKCALRTAPSDKVNAVKNGNDDVKVAVNQEVSYIKTTTGPNNGKSNQTWYAVKMDYAAREYTGYLAKACMYDVKTYSYNDDSAFEDKISSFPASYKPYLRKLHAAHPNWTFEADYTSLNWEDAAEAESQKGTSAISKYYPSLMFKDSIYPNGLLVDGTSWYAPAKDAVKYYMDARNFLTEKNVFMFQSLAYNANEDSSVSKLLSGTFMSGSFTENGVTKTYANAFIEAAKESNVSSVHLASRALQEMGTRGSSASSGKVSGYEGYYNFYNIGATSGADNYLKGLEYAKNNGWNSIQKAITEGAKFIGSGYITKGQDTLYFQKFNVSKDRVRNAYTHQYQTNIMAPESETSSIYNSYSKNGKLGNSYNFVIPVYNARPDKAFKVSRTDTVGGNDTSNGSTEVDNKKDDSTVTTTTKNNVTTTTKKNETTTKTTTTTKTATTTTAKPVVKPDKKVTNCGYKLNGSYLSGVRLGEDISGIKNYLQKQGGTVSTLNKNWISKVSGKIATGDIISIDDMAFETVVYGDISGDGAVTIKDLLLVQKHLLRNVSLSGANKMAADVSKDNAVTIKDLLLIQKYLLGSGSINQ